MHTTIAHSPLQTHHHFYVSFLKQGTPIASSRNILRDVPGAAELHDPIVLVAADTRRLSIETANRLRDGHWSMAQKRALDQVYFLQQPQSLVLRDSDTIIRHPALPVAG